MTLPANIRVNIGAPFPSQVKGSALITIAKSNGIWTVGFSMANVAGMPGGTDLNTVEVLLYNTVLKTFQQATVAFLLSSLPITPTLIGFLQSPYVPLVTDTLLYVDTSGGPVVINLTVAAARANLPLSIKDITGNANVNNVTINRNGAETIEGLASIKIAAKYGGYRLYPAAAKYVIAP